MMMMFDPLAAVFGFTVILSAALLGLRIIGGGIRDNESGPASDRAGIRACPGDRDPLEILRERYARGEIGYEELERSLDNLVVHSHGRAFSENSLVK